jgi:hypothetical protein
MVEAPRALLVPVSAKLEPDVRLSLQRLAQLSDRTLSGEVRHALHLYLLGQHLQSRSRDVKTA